MRPSEVALLVLCAIATWTDLRTRRIPNLLTFPVMGLGIALAGYQGGLPAVRESGLGLALGFAVLFPFFATGGTGAGDVKLVMATGSLVGWRVLVPSFAVGGLLIGLYSLLAVLRQGRTVGGVIPFLMLMRQELAVGTATTDRVTAIWLPWGPCLSVGALGVLLGGWRPLG